MTKRKPKNPAAERQDAIAGVLMGAYVNDGSTYRDTTMGTKTDARPPAGHVGYVCETGRRAHGKHPAHGLCDGRWRPVS